MRSLARTTTAVPQTVRTATLPAWPTPPTSFGAAQFPRKRTAKLPTMRIVALVAVIFLVGCHTSPPESQQPPGNDSSASAESDSPSVFVENGNDGEQARGLPGPELPVGPRCDSDADCGDAMICEGVGCGSNEGRCVEKERMCTRDLAQYCGCDGRTFQGSGTCPGARFAYRGPCEPKREDGEPCSDGRQCKSDSCVGEGLEGCSRGDEGVCGVASCTTDLSTYCGCNNVEFQASGTCPNRQFAYRGPCEG